MQHSTTIRKRFESIVTIIYQPILPAYQQSGCRHYFLRQKISRAKMKIIILLLAVIVFTILMIAYFISTAEALPTENEDF